jgi:hypothetical protein
MPLIFMTEPPPLPSLDNGDFEAGQDGSWTESSQQDVPLIVNSFEPNPLTPHSGKWGGWLGGVYEEEADLSQEVSIPPDSTSVFLTYWYWISSVDDCGFDHGWVEVNGTKLKNYDLCSTNNTNSWVKHSVDISNFAGQTVTINFHVDTDDIFNSNFFLDDVAFNASATINTELTQPVRPASDGAANTQLPPQNSEGR